MQRTSQNDHRKYFVIDWPLWHHMKAIQQTTTHRVAIFCMYELMVIWHMQKLTTLESKVHPLDQSLKWRWGNSDNVTGAIAKYFMGAILNMSDC